MKQCSTCREEFADKFSFCPVDGTPLMEEVTEAARPSLPEKEKATPSTESFTTDNNQAAQPPAETPGTALVRAGEYHLTFVDDTGLTRRLANELKEVAHDSELTWPEFKRDPFGYSGRFFKGYGSLIWRFFSSRNVAIATSTALLVVLSVIVIFIVVGKREQKRQEEIAQADLTIEQIIDTDTIPPE